MAQEVIQEKELPTLIHILTTYLRRYNGDRKKAQRTQKDYKTCMNISHTKVEQVEKERNYDRSWQTKQHLVNLKKEKLAAKRFQIQNGKKI